MATTIEQERAGTFVERARIGWGIGVLAALALAAVAVAAVVFMTQAPSAQVDESPVRSSIYTQDELEVFRLVDAGVLPSSVLDAEPFRTKRLVAQGVIPRETLVTGVPIEPTLSCPEERAVMKAVSAGLIPAEVLDGEPFRTRRLIAQGLIPWQAAEPCAW
jgi:hypothetical protein